MNAFDPRRLARLLPVLALSACLGPSPMHTGPLDVQRVEQIPVPDTWAAALSTGRFVDGNGDGAFDAADPQQIWAASHDGHSMIDPLGGPSPTRLVDAWRSSGRVVDVDPNNPGPEYVTLSYERSGPGHVTSFDGAAELSRTGMAAVEGGTEPWFADLDGNGTVEVVTYNSIRDARTGNLINPLQGVPVDENGTGQAVSADLDGDGIQEVIAFHHGLGLRYYSPSGQVLATCRGGTGNWSIASFAVGNLDNDPEGEVVAAGDGFLVVCDSDGTVLREVGTNTRQPPMIGLAELDGDIAPEIVIGDAQSLEVYDDDLSPLWSRPAPNNVWEWYPFSVADLDDDGYHEILITERKHLLVLAGNGAVRADVPASSLKASWMGQPIVTDIDADGLAEILIPTRDTISVYDDGAGGWDLPEAELPWSGVNRFPGNRDEAGAIPVGGQPHWVHPETNVWQGLPTTRHPMTRTP